LGIAVAEVNVSIARFVTLARSSDCKGANGKTGELHATVGTGELFADNLTRETNELYSYLCEPLFIDSIANVDQDLPQVIGYLSGSGLSEIKRANDNYRGCNSRNLSVPKETLNDSTIWPQGGPRALRGF
jgi:hypothetical protein